MSEETGCSDRARGRGRDAPAPAPGSALAPAPASALGLALDPNQGCYCGGLRYHGGQLQARDGGEVTVAWAEASLGLFVVKKSDIVRYSPLWRISSSVSELLFA